MLSTSFLEQGRWFKLMMETFPEVYPNQEELGKRVGVSHQHVSRLIQYYETETQTNIAPHGAMDNSEPSCEEAKSSTSADQGTEQAEQVALNSEEDAAIEQQIQRVSAQYQVKLRKIVERKKRAGGKNVLEAVKRYADRLENR